MTLFCQIYQGGEAIACLSLIMVPAQALQEAGYIRTLTTAQTAQSKHEFHALAQTALLQYEDGEVAAVHSSAPLIITAAEERLRMADGLLIGRRPDGRIMLLTNSDRPPRKLIEAAYRYCTRWVRLDI